MCFVYSLSFRSSGETTMLGNLDTNAIRPVYSFETIKSTFSKRHWVQTSQLYSK